MRPGDLFAGRFRIDAQLGQGGMGAVYSATNVVLGRRVALKVLLTHVALRDDALRRFMREARASASIRHPNVIEILDVITDDGGAPAIVMELLSGRSLAASIHGRRLAVEEAASWMIPVCSGVGTAHARGIVHRDLKPENVFLAEEHGRVTPKVLDFGIAKLVDPLDLGESDGQTRTGAVLGTPHYMAPEQAFGERDVDHRADIWSLGVILYEALAGTRPFNGDNAGQILRQLANPSPAPLIDARPDLPKDVLDLVSSMMASDRSARPATLADVTSVLSRYSAVRAPEFGTAQISGAHAALSADELHRVSQDPTIIAPLGTAHPAPTIGASTDPMTRPPSITHAAVITDRPPAPRRAPIAIALVVVLAIGAGGFFALRKPPPPTDTARAPEPSAMIAEHAVESVATPEAPKPVPPVELPPLPSSAKVTGKAPGKPAPSAKPSISSKPLVVVAPSATSTGKGGLIETVPF